LRVVISQQITLVGFYQTSFPIDGKFIKSYSTHQFILAFEPEELVFFAIVGLFSGFIGAFFIIFYRSVVMFLRQNNFAKRFFQTK
jgi:H+/Cl- antiporter ClcA